MVFRHFKPAWLVLVLLYWVLAIPNKVSIGWAFLLGLVWDLILGSTLGIHALVLSVTVYFVAKKLSGTQKFIALVSKPFSDCVCVYC